jgi:hypothetical protein
MVIVFRIETGIAWGIDHRSVDRDRCRLKDRSTFRESRPTSKTVRVDDSTETLRVDLGMGMEVWSDGYCWNHGRVPAEELNR